MSNNLRIRPLEKEDLRFIHHLDNNASIMRYWFEEPYESFLELSDLYDKHIHDKSERRFILQLADEESRIGLVELVEIDYTHRRAEFQIIIAPGHQGQGYARHATKLAMDYAFFTLNLYKLYLVVDEANEKAIHIYSKLGFSIEGTLRHEFFSAGAYRNAIRMCIFQDEYRKLGL
ncbi:spermidine N1-acetyltransferase [Wohlfahrtiimonas sp. G9077]|uniref:spermidine N1-acetyltransferase n=1 Tax=Wohlfahrtiimonas sp. G9077 TaxID=1980118 RepID=UPI000B97D8DA|nr:spermidine N1-acetyltransferase [Wohlfahrtiimonas sp. G9077]OYQ72936.1 spermidine acetyltransferase [Wohlfahrtiimonas sp. G9077]